MSGSEIPRPLGERFLDHLLTIATYRRQADHH